MAESKKKVTKKKATKKKASKKVSKKKVSKKVVKEEIKKVSNKALTLEERVDVLTSFSSDTALKIMDAVKKLGESLGLDAELKVYLDVKDISVKPTQEK